ncbi:MAG: flagellar export protein FliJ [Gammaproteobacteria bacterium]|nr:flagellar export protein FliJ [Gammaproteobacteria bacterium]
MAVSRSQRMTVVLQLANRAEEAAVNALNDSRENVERAREQLEQISRYQQEYTRQLNAKTAGLSAQNMINDRRFLQQLGQALSAQQQQILQLQQAETGCLRNWQQCYQRRQGIEKLIQSLKSAEDASAEKLLQKELDELSSLFRNRET